MLFNDRQTLWSPANSARLRLQNSRKRILRLCLVRLQSARFVLCSNRVDLEKAVTRETAETARADESNRGREEVDSAGATRIRGTLLRVHTSRLAGIRWRSLQTRGHQYESRPKRELDLQVAVA